MERLLELLAQIAALVAANEERPLGALPQDELEGLLADLQAAYAEVRGGTLDAEAIDSLEQAAEAIQAVIAEDNVRITEADELEARAAALDALAIPTAQDDGGDDGGEGDDAAADEPVDEADEPSGGELVPADEVEVVDEQVLVPARSRVPLERLRQRVPAQARPRPRQEENRRRVIAAAGIPTVAAGGEFSNPRDLANALISTWDANRRSSGDGVQVAVARVETPYEESMRVSSSADAFSTMEAFRHGTNQWLDALTAAGGICAPTVPYYQQAMISQSQRPVYDGLTRFNADRGGINWIAPPTLASITTSAVGVQTAGTAIAQVTAAQDLANATKPHQAIACGAAQSAQVYAVTNILEFGNLQSRTYPELVEAWVGLAEAAWARYAENLLLTGIVNGSTAVTSVQVLGVARDILNYATVAAEAYRSRHRMADGAPLVAMFPRWLIGAIQADVWSGFNTGTDEAASVTQARVEAWFASRNIRVIWFQDGVGPGNPAAQIFPAQAAGALLGWPKVCQWYLFHEGAWLILDAGTLDLGIVRDSTLNAANKYQMFFESFENVAFVGIESLRIRTTICVNGATAGTVDPNTICDGGS